MSLIRKTLFISDLHLDESWPQSSEQFLHFLQNFGPNIDAIYILGDLFETWIGDDNKTPFNQKIVSALRSVTETGLPVFFLCGNRDFLIGRRFLRATGCQRLADEEKISLYGTDVLLMHGDTLCSDDVDYLKARKILRNRFYTFWFELLVPLKARQRFADNLRKKSRQYTKTATKQIMDVTQATVLQVMQKHNVNYLIHGHTHRPAIHQFTINEKASERIVLGAWEKNASVLEWDSTGRKELVVL